MFVLTKKSSHEKNYLWEINRIFVKKHEQKLSSVEFKKMFVKIPEEKKIFVRLKNLRAPRKSSAEQK